MKSLTREQVVVAIEQKDLETIKIAIAQCEEDRNIQSFDECYDMLTEAVIHVVPDYCTSCIGYHGPVVIVLWPASPGAVSTFILDDNGIKHCNSTSW